MHLSTINKDIIMKFQILFIVVFFSFLSCKTQEVKNTNINQSNLNVEKLKSIQDYEMRMKGIDFFASGKEPFWSLEIDYDQMVCFKSDDLDKDIIIPIRRLGQEIEMPEVNYEIKGDNVDLKIDIKPNENPFIYDEKNRPYMVQMEVKKSKDAEWVTYQGQGEYYGDLILHDIWDLEKINSKSVSEYKIEKNPYLEIHLDKNRISGFLGCNKFGGQCYFGRGKIVVGHLISTKMACLNTNIEADFAKALSNNSFLYRVDNGILTLWNDHNKLILKKRD